MDNVKDLLKSAAMTIAFMFGVVGVYHGIIMDGSLWWALLGGVSVGVYSGMVTSHD